MNVQLFSNSIWKVSHNNDHIFREIETLIAENKLTNDTTVRSHISINASPGIVHGSHDGMYSLQLFKKYEDQLGEFLDFVDWEIIQYCESVSWTRKEYIFLHSWLNMTPRDTYQEWHIHANAFRVELVAQRSIPEIGDDHDEGDERTREERCEEIIIQQTGVRPLERSNFLFVHAASGCFA